MSKYNHYYIKDIFLILAISLTFISCSDSESEDPFGENTTTEIELCKKLNIDKDKYQDFSYLLREKYYVVTGLDNNYIWIAAYDTLTYRKTIEFKESTPLKEEETIYVGYGETLTGRLSRYTLRDIEFIGNGFIGIVAINYSAGSEGMFLIKTLFDNGKVITETLTSYPNILNVEKWYKESAFVSNAVCYSVTGDSLYVIKTPKRGVELPISYTDGIELSLTPNRINHKTGETVWESKVEPSFEIPQNAKVSITVSEQSTDYLNCKAAIVYYDGNKKVLDFKINIENGEITIL